MKDNSKSRIIICLVLAFLIFGLFVARLFSWQILQSEEYKKLSAQAASYEENFEATRGEILDVDGNPLSVNKTAYNIVINKIYIKDGETNSIILSLIKLMNECDAKWLDVLPIKLIDGSYEFDKDYESDLEYIRSQSMLNDENLTSPETIIEKLTERYDAENIGTKEEQRDVVSVRYNMEKKGFSFSTSYVFASKINEETVAIISERTQEIPAVEIRTTNERVIKNGTLIPHILGVVGAMSEEDYEAHKDDGYSLDDEIGKFGIEEALESELKGKAGTKMITKDEKGNVVSETNTVEAKPGNTVYLTINSNIQEVANYSLAKNVKLAREEGEREVKAAKANNKKQTEKLGEDCYCGGAVMLSLKDFSVLAAASCPNYDLSKYYDSDYSEYLYTDEHAPLYSRAFLGAFAPGSSFKPCVALAALQEGIITENTEITCTQHYDYYKNYVVDCMGKHGTIALRKAIERSCNYYFAEVGRRTGINTMYLYAEKFGLGVKTGLEIDENTGVLAGRDSTSWYEGNTVQAAIGQSDNTFTAVQLATYVATIANDGVRYRTHLVRKITDYERENTVLYNDPDKPEIMSDAEISKDNLQIVKEGMRQVVTAGTAEPTAGKYPIKLAAKTGTAENAGSDHVTIICYGPYEDPEVAVAVVVEHGSISKFAINTALDMLDAYFYGKTVDEVKKSARGD